MVKGSRKREEREHQQRISEDRVRTVIREVIRIPTENSRCYTSRLKAAVVIDRNRLKAAVV